MLTNKKIFNKHKILNHVITEESILQYTIKLNIYIDQ